MGFLLDRGKKRAETINVVFSVMNALTKQLGAIVASSIVIIGIGSGGVCHAFELPCASLAVSIPDLSAANSLEERTYPAQTALGLEEIATACATDIPRSWEEDVECCDVVDFIDTLPVVGVEDQGKEIDERTCRQLFEDVIRRALFEMDLKIGGDSTLEEILKQDLLYFTPEFEYYWPIYPQDPSVAIVRFPVEVKRLQASSYKQDDTDTLLFHLGRPGDDYRTLAVTFLDRNGEKELVCIELCKDRLIPGVLGEPKKEVLSLLWQAPDFSRTTLYKMYFDQDNTVYQEAEPLLVFDPGCSSATVDNTAGEPALELSGVERLFDPDRLAYYYNNPEPYDAGYFQAIRGIVNLCKLQLGLEHNGFELEQVLRNDFLEYVPWPPIDEHNFDAALEPAIELVSVWREEADNPNEVLYGFKIGDIFRRYLYITFDKTWGESINCPWGIKEIEFIQLFGSDYEPDLPQLEALMQSYNIEAELIDRTYEFRKLFTFECQGCEANYYHKLVDPQWQDLLVDKEGNLYKIAYFLPGKPSIE